MIVDRYDAVDLCGLIPGLRLEMEPELAELDRLLDDDVVFNRVKLDVSRRYPNSGIRGRHCTPVEVILRMLVVRRLYNWSYEQTERNVSDSLVLRQFCRLYLVLLRLCGHFERRRCTLGGIVAARWAGTIPSLAMMRGVGCAVHSVWT